MIFQEPMTSLNPVFTRRRPDRRGAAAAPQTIARAGAARSAIEMLRRVGIPAPEQRARRLSAPALRRHAPARDDRHGARLRPAAADRRRADHRARRHHPGADPRADAHAARRDSAWPIILITHDLGVVAELADDVVVMYAGPHRRARRRCSALFAEPQHPYTIGLLGSIPRLHREQARLAAIEGLVPDAAALPERLPLPAALPVRDRPVPRARSRRCARSTPEPSAPPAGARRCEPEPLLRAERAGQALPGAQQIFGRARGACTPSTASASSSHAGETLALVGESGCGKSTAGRLLLRLIEPTAGSVVLRGQRPVGAARRASCARCAAQMQIIFQDPYALAQSAHDGGRRCSPSRCACTGSHAGREARARRRAAAAWSACAASTPQRYPHEFSGGQRQRIGIARALAVEPQLIVCDEPVSALDVSIQAQVINLLQDLQRALRPHLPLHRARPRGRRAHRHRVAVMYLGKIVEIADKRALFARPRHPYTQALLSAIPVPDPDAVEDARIVLQGDVPSPFNPPSGCRFHTRCPYARERCADGGAGSLEERRRVPLLERDRALCGGLAIDGRQ